MKKMVLLPAFLLLLLGNALAQGAGEQLIVNGQDLLCAVVPTGDDCSRCQPLQGWDIIGEPGFSQCPEGFEFIEVEPECLPIKSMECCTAGSSGSQGDCEGLALNSGLGFCAFVETSANCGLPDGWASLGGVGPILCPTTYVWVEGIECVEGRPGPTPSSPGNSLGNGPGNGTDNGAAGPDFVLVAAGLLVLALAAALIYTNAHAKRKGKGIVPGKGPVGSKRQVAGKGQVENPAAGEGQVKKPLPENGPNAKKL